MKIMNTEERLDRLEKQNRNLRRGLVGLLLLVSCSGGETTETDASAMDSAKVMISVIDMAVKFYYLENAGWMPTLEDLIIEDENGQVYLNGFSETPKDPWGTEYEIRRGKKPGSWEVISWGPDGLPNTDDDISSKTLKNR